MGLFDKPQKDLRQPLLDPGMEKMLELDKRIHLIARPPPAPELVTALKAFVESKLAKRQSLEDFHAAQVLQTIENLEERNEEGRPAWLNLYMLNSTLILAANGSQKIADVHNRLCRTIFKAMQQRVEAGEQQDLATEEKRLVIYISVLCRSGHAVEARDVLEAFWQRTAGSNSGQVGAWARVLRGLSKEDNEAEILRTLQIMERLSIPLTTGVHREMTIFYARRDNVAETKKWFKKEIFRNQIPAQESVYRVILEFCLRNKEMEWSQNALQSDLDETAEQHTWDAIFQAAAATGKSVEEIDRMMGVMTRRSQSSGNISTVNALMEYAISKSDPYMAERYFGLATKWNLKPNAQTYILQVQYRLSAGDLDGAKSAYARLREQHINDNEDWSIMNQLIQALASHPQADHEAIMGLVDDLSERKTTFPAETVSTLSVYHLQRDEYFEVVDLLQTYAYQFSTSQRTQLRDQLSTVTLDPKTDISRAWDTYMIFHQVFDLETKRDIRNAVMTRFFERGRPDLATHVFSRMSNHVRADTRPDTDTYVRALEGIALNSEPEALEVVHNLLKLDTDIEPSTRLYNALMLAYTACDAPWRSLEYWEDISRSREGPSYNSLIIAFQACEKTAFGFRNARAIWEKLEQADIEISRDLFAAYIGALSGNHLFDDVVAMLARMEQIVGHGPDKFT